MTQVAAIRRILTGWIAAGWGLAGLVLAAPPVHADPAAEIAAAARAVEADVVSWRRDIHRHPELSNREFRTARLVAEHLESLGLEVRTGVAHTGVVGILRGSHPGPVVALRADMDALPVVERTRLPFASQARATRSGMSYRSSEKSANERAREKKSNGGYPAP